MTCLDQRHLAFFSYMLSVFEPSFSLIFPEVLRQTLLRHIRRPPRREPGRSDRSIHWRSEKVKAFESIRVSSRTKPWMHRGTEPVSLRKFWLLPDLSLDDDQRIRILGRPDPPECRALFQQISRLASNLIKKSTCQSDFPEFLGKLTNLLCAQLVFANLLWSFFKNGLHGRQEYLEHILFVGAQCSSGGQQILENIFS